MKLTLPDSFRLPSRAVVSTSREYVLPGAADKPQRVFSFLFFFWKLKQDFSMCYPVCIPTSFGKDDTYTCKFSCRSLLKPYLVGYLMTKYKLSLRRAGLVHAVLLSLASALLALILVLYWYRVMLVKSGATLLERSPLVALHLRGTNNNPQ